MKTTEPFWIQFGGFLLRLCFPDFLAIFLADFPFNLHTLAFIRTLFDSPGKFSIFSTKLDFSTNVSSYIDFFVMTRVWMLLIQTPSEVE
jgi:hypothetical protein